MAKEVIVELDDRATIVGKKGAAVLEEGREYIVHPLHAEKLIKKGEAEKVKKAE